MSNIPFIQARHFTQSNSKINQLIVLHCMEAPEKGSTAENVARYFSHMNDGRVASAHFCIDNNSIVQCVQCKDVAYGAKGGNKNGIHLEFAGYAKQTREEWLDDYGQMMLLRAAILCRQVLMPKFGIPAKWVTPAKIRKAREDTTIRGFCTHADITEAFGIVGGHTDPGDGFPRGKFMELLSYQDFHVR